MSPHIGFGKIAGVQVRANWSLLVAFWLITWGLATVTLPAIAPDGEIGAYWVAGIASALVFFGSLLVHELAHCIVARSVGVEVSEITLWLFGGVSRLAGEPRRPSDEMRIAIVGPLASLAIAVVIFAAARLAQLVGSPEVVIAAAFWLGFVNLVLAVFNMLPGAPLDGGRMLHARVWRRTGDRNVATQVAARAGRVLGYSLIAGGLVGLVFGFGPGSLWLVFLGWFVLYAARAESVGALVREGLAGVCVRDVMTLHPTVVPVGASVADLIEDYVLSLRYSGFPVASACGDIVGLVTLDQIRSVPAGERSHTEVAVVAAPVSAVATAAPSDSLTELLERTAAKGTNRALVFDDGRLVGIVSPSDIARIVEIAALVAPARAQPARRPRPGATDRRHRLRPGGVGGYRHVGHAGW